MKWAILGAGEIANRSMAPALNRAADTKLHAVYCRTIDRARAFAEKHHAEKAYDSIEAMLRDGQVEAVYIATPNSLHREHAVAAAKAGKHVLVEKPMATTVADAEAIIEAAARANVKLGVVFHSRYHSAHVETRRQIEAGALGEIQLATAQLCRGYARGGHWEGWRVDPVIAGAGAIVGHAVHPIDLLRYVMGSEVAEVQAITDEKPRERPVEEISYALLKFENGTVATVVAGAIIPRYDNDLVLYGERAKVRCTATLGVLRAGAKPGMTVEDDKGARTIELSSDDSNPAKFARMVEDFTRAVRANTEPMLNGENGLQMVRIALAMQRSSREGKAIAIER